MKKLRQKSAALAICMLAIIAAPIIAKKVFARDSLGSRQELNVLAPVLGTSTPVRAAAATFAVANGRRSVAVADFNGDGKQGLAIANYDSSTVCILLGDGAGGFNVTANLQTFSGTGSVAVGDFNGDGK